MRSGMIFAGPGIPRGQSVNAFAYLFDIYPTLCDVAGAPKPESLDGKSLMPVIQGKTAQVRDTVLLGYRDFQRAVRQGQWKLIRYPQIDRTQLFDLEADPYEINDLAARPEQRARVEQLMKALRAQQRIFGDKLPLTAEHPRPGDINLEFFATKKG